MIDRHRAVAIVGVGFRLPGDIETTDALWDALANKKNLITEVDNERWTLSKYWHPRKSEAGKSYTFKAGVISKINEFDASFFGVSPREAYQMDPQQRLLLEVTWEALENGNQDPEKLAGSQCGVFIGAASTEHVVKYNNDLSIADSYTMLGSCASIIANRISYLFDFHGPSFVLDTACSSSMVALHQACSSMRLGEISSAVVGGINILLSPMAFVGFSKAMMLSPDGACKSFDAKGNGYARAEGCVVLYLKPLADAQRDGDPIQAVILNTGVNTNGRTNGIALPSATAQAELISQVHGQIGLMPDDIGYVEAHGTGTAIGDPIEAQAIAEAMTQHRTSKDPLLIGSIKSNIGHLEMASGLAGVLKAVLCFKYDKIPATAHFEIPNPTISFEKLKLRVVDRLTNLPENKKIVINSFGFGGANGHVVLEGYCKTPTKNNNTSHRVSPLFLSVRSEAAFSLLAKQYQDLFKKNPEKFYDVAYALAKQRAQHHHRMIVRGNTVNEIIENLEKIERDQKSSAVKGAAIGKKLSVALVYSGNGSQWQGMGQQLMQEVPLIAETIRDIDALFSQYGDFSIYAELSAPINSSRYASTEVAQPCLFALQVAMTKYLWSQGLIVQAVLGHSIGEVTAAWASGALTLEQAVHVIYVRSFWQGKTRGNGKMAAIALSNDDTKKMLVELDLLKMLTISAINSPKGVTVAGDLAALEKLQSVCAEKNIFYTILDLDYAFHSAFMDPIRNDLLSALAELFPQKTTIDYISTVNGKVLEGTALTANYWWRNIREPVQFSVAIDSLVSGGVQLFIEVGPHPVLKRYIADCFAAREVKGAAFSTMQRQSATLKDLDRVVAQIWMSGAQMNLDHWFPVNGNHVEIPAYPWIKEKYELKTSTENFSVMNLRLEHPLLGYRLKADQPIWENHLDATLIPYLADHVVSGLLVMPGAAYIEMALAAAALWYGNTCFDIGDIEIFAPMIFNEVACRQVSFSLEAEGGRFQIKSRLRHSDEPWIVHVIGVMRDSLAHIPERSIAQAFLDLKKSGKYFSEADCLERSSSKGVILGPTFQSIKNAWVKDSSVLAYIKLHPDVIATLHQYQLHPTLLDTCFQLVCLDDIGYEKYDMTLPFRVGRLKVFGKFSSEMQITAVFIKRSKQSVVINYAIASLEGSIVAELTHCRFKNVYTDKRVSSNQNYICKPIILPSTEIQKANTSQWLILTDKAETIAPLIAPLKTKVSIITFEKDISQFQLALMPFSAQENTLSILYCVGINHAADNMLSAVEERCNALTYLIKAIKNVIWINNPTLTVVTQGGALCGETLSQKNPEHAAVWGFTRVLMNEHPELQCRLIDLQGDVLTELSQHFMDAVLQQEAESEVIISSSARYGLRVYEADSVLLLQDENKDFRLDFLRPGPLKNLQWFPLEKTKLAEDDIAVKPLAAGLNFRDVMYSMGLIPDEAIEEGFLGQTLGMEFAGEVVEMGSGVHDFAIGDKVMGFAPTSFSSHVVSKHHVVSLMPKGWTYSEAATIPIAFLTVYYSLVHLARMHMGERLLIHGAAGGVGVAAIQLAKHLGVEIHATAGSDEKRAYLAELGIEYIYDSRSLAFADQVMEKTNNEGIDVVLNCLAGEAISINFTVLKPFGRFLELGKRDFYANSKIGLRPFRNNISFFGIDADQLIKSPSLSKELCKEIFSLFHRGILKPLPYHEFSTDEIHDAFRYMQQAKNIGKIVVDLSKAPTTNFAITKNTKKLILNSSATYLVTGGLNGFGFRTAQWLVENGAQHLVLVGRSGVRSEEVKNGIAEFITKGIGVHVKTVDITDKTAVDKLIQDITRDLPPLKGIFHAAAVYDDAIIMNMTDEKMHRVLAPKIQGAVNLHKTTKALPLDYFVVYSSVTTLLGNPGQANYVAANAFLEKLMDVRRSAGLAGFYVAWGAIDDVGYLARNIDVKNSLSKKLGVSTLTSTAALQTLTQFLLKQSEYTGVVIAELNGKSLRRMLSAGLSKFESIVADDQDDASDQINSQDNIRTQLAEGLLTEADIAALIAHEVGKILYIAPDKINLDQRLLSLGMDSLMGIELVNSIEQSFGVTIPILIVSQNPTINDLVKRITAQLLKNANIAKPSKVLIDFKSDELATEAKALAAAMEVEWVGL